MSKTIRKDKVRTTLQEIYPNYLVTPFSQILVYGNNAAAGRVLKHGQGRALPVIDATITQDCCQEQLNSLGVCVLVDCSENLTEEWLASACIASGTHYIARSCCYHASTT